jgi:replicative DNA helicase
MPERRNTSDLPPPHSLEAEMSLLGSVLIDPDQIRAVSPIVTPSDFYSEAHAAIAAAAWDVFAQCGSGDLVQTVERLRDRAQLELVGGPDYLVKLAGSVPSSVNAPHYGKIVAEKSRARRLLKVVERAGWEIVNGVGHRAGGIDELAAEVADSARGLLTGDAAAETDLSDLLRQVAADVEDPKPNRGAMLGIGELDALLGGVQPGSVCVVAARPSMGKTAFALGAALNVVRAGCSAVFVSAEMPARAIAERTAAALTGATVAALRQGGDAVDDRTYRDLLALQDRIPRGALSVLPMRQLGAIRHAVAERVRTAAGTPRPVRIVCIDYLGLLEGSRHRGQNRTAEIGELSRAIKAMAVELDVPVLLLSQLNRALEARDNRRPRLADLRDSGDIEQDADAVVFLHRPSYFHQGDRAWELEHLGELDAAELIVAKNRNGPCGSARARWVPERMTFEEPTP